VKLDLERVQCGPGCTIGSLTLDGTWMCWTCEDEVREVPGQPVATWKVPGKTAIPAGIYEVDITRSQRFGRDLPILLAVPGFTGVRIHPGNTAADTEGCLLPGLQRAGQSVGQSRKAFDQIFQPLRDARARRERITIRIWRP
jgi:hypothetical protein